VASSTALPEALGSRRRLSGLGAGCKQANVVSTYIGGDPVSVAVISQELSEAAARHLKLFLDQLSVSFEKHHEQTIKLYDSIPLHQGWQALRSVTLSFDIGFFNEALAKLANLPAEGDDHDRHRARDNLQLDADQNGGWSNKGVSPWRLLLHHPFDKVTILISDDSRNNSTDTDARAEKYRNVVSILRESLGDMMENIGSDWLTFQHALDWNVLGEEEYPRDRCFNKYGEYNPTPKRKWYKSAELFRFARVQHERLSHKWERREVEKAGLRGGTNRRGHCIQIRQICFAWNFLPATTPVPPKLQGKKLTYAAELAEEHRKTDQLPKLTYNKLWPHKYEVAAADGLIGEMGLCHPKRWILANEEYTEYYGLSGRLTEAEDVESKGIGMPVKKVRKPRAKKVKSEE
jgi:hypothetical protein